MTTFVALDVETANPDMSSICQIGIVKFQDGKLEESWVSLVNPEDYFDPMNISIHGIDESSVMAAPTFQELYSTIVERLSGAIVASHTSFDRLAVMRATEKYELSEVECRWLDTARVVRRTWSEFRRQGYGLANICAELGVMFTHHNAEEDARAAGEVLIHAIAKTGIAVEEWLDRAVGPIDLSFIPSSKIAMDGNPDGSLFGEVLVFTGELAMSRRVAAEVAARAGCQVASAVTKKTTLLVVGDQDIRMLVGHEKSAKHRRVEQLIAKGVDIRILGESDFIQLIAL